MAKTLLRLLIVLVLTTNLTLIAMLKFIRNEVEQNYKSVLLDCEMLLDENQMMPKIQADLEDIQNRQTMPMVYLITTTYQRDTQKADLVVLCQTLMHVQSLVWIVVENSVHPTPMVQALLKRCGVPYVHLTIPPPYYAHISPTSELVGTQHRNVGLKWIRENCGCGECNDGVIYFGDDDDRYDLRIFNEIRNTDTISVFMVGLTGGLLMEGPYCKEGKLEKWHYAWGNSRHIPVDMQGFAISLRLVLKHTDIWLERTGTYNSMGYLEASRFISRFLPHTTLECRTHNNEVLVWRTQTMQPETFREQYDRTNASIEY